MSTPFAQALVLGQSAYAQRIARALVEAGFEARLAPDVDDLATLKRTLGDFAHSAGRIPSHFAHLVHPGVGHWGERPELGAYCQELGLAALTPSARCQTLFSNPLQLLEFAEAREIPHLVAGFEPMQSLREILATVRESGLSFPVVLKNIRREGFAGVLVAKSEEDLALRLPAWVEELREATGEVALFVEKYVEAARYIEVPFARFKDGRVRLLPRVDASLQLRGHRYVDLCPAANLETALERQFDQRVRRIAKDTSFVGVGALEFLCEGSSAWFVGGRAGLSSSFPLWEKVGGLCAVSLQLASFGLLPEESATERDDVRAGALARLYAEDPLLELPRPGRITELSESGSRTFSTGTLEVEFAFKSGQEVGPSGDGFLGFLLSTGATPQAAVHALGLSLSSPESPVWIAGTLQTNERYLSELLLHPWVREGFFHTAFLDEEFVPRRELPLDLLRGVGGALGPRLTPGAWVVADRLKMQDAAAWSAHAWQWIDPCPEGGWLKGPANERVRVGVASLASGMWNVRAGNAFFTIRPLDAPHPQGLRPLKALTSGTIQALRFQEGKEVPVGHVLLHLRSLKRIVAHSLGRKVRLVKWEVAPGRAVEAGSVLGWVELRE